MSPSSYFTLLPPLHSSGHPPTELAGSKVGLEVGEMEPLQYPINSQAVFQAPGDA
eukprot:CAMPEP_0172568784 /NCGR_PEP_ID=MMETSP1067-20121228/121090_1 /TAXON_ID=265564 ORGANISM="Thalassiosira punctigera, Strain Tpunct2005C2" /NCGR_SAMPLE_ID=MMETSP1067 /ASSEMBLY_ACC=CAM_ASM_000444 /LENGTH=54 /DNA_ID=CAMNT_0013360469 /DNA_START=68 /DNA_END=228 /DNA_ORIENTATION=-